MVYVISQDDKPLMPCSNPIARLLLKQGKAKVKKREPFTTKARCGVLWSRGYFVSTVGHISEATVIKYIEEQKNDK